MRVAPFLYIRLHYYTLGPLPRDVIRTTVGLDLYNILNANPVLTESRALASFRAPQDILGARFAEVILKLDF